MLVNSITEMNNNVHVVENDKTTKCNEKLLSMALCGNVRNSIFAFTKGTTSEVKLAIRKLARENSRLVIVKLEPDFRLYDILRVANGMRLKDVSLYIDGYNQEIDSDLTSNLSDRFKRIFFTRG